MAKKSNLYIIIIGCGRLGSKIAANLSNKGHSVVVLDKNESSFQHLTQEFTGFSIAGNATEIESLKKAKIDKADMVLALTNNDNINYMVSQVAKEVYQTPHVIARIYNPDNVELFKQINVQVIIPMLLAEIMFNETFEELLGEDA
ncbi:MAG TPA: TrkA family potassium uptake protein [Thermotogota bacterium]|nr:TrkA family potassium uptake protein [Thermotogota bacterium]HRW34268.1 TrkA family potassium uptake protein [Thermotogota bacterium]